MPSITVTTEQLTELSNHLAALQNAIAEMIAQPEPEEPEQPAEPEQPEPQVIHTFDLPQGKSGEWNQGASVKSQRLTVVDTPANREAIVPGNQFRFVDGSVRNITRAPASSNRIWPEYDGDTKVDGSKVGYPNKVEVLSGVAAEHTPKPDDDPSVPSDLPEPPVVVEPPPVKPAPPAYLNGVNMSGGMFGHNLGLPGKEGAQYKWADASWYNLYKARGCYLFRTGFLWERMQQKLDGPIDEKEVGFLIAALKAAKANNQKVIPEIHNYGRRNDKVIGASGGPTYAQYADFCAKLVERLKGEDCYSAMLALGLMNEPQGEADKHMPAAYQQAINAVAAVDIDLTLSVCGLSWASAARWPSASDVLKSLSHPKGRDKILMEFHQYLDPDASGTYSNRSQTFDPQIGVSRVKPAIDWCKKYGFRAFLGEYGLPPNNTSAAVAVRNMLDYCNANGVMTAAWCAGPWWTTDNVTALDTTHGAAGTGPVRSQLTTVMPFFTVKEKV